MANIERPYKSSQPRFGWAFFGTELRRRRESCGLTQQELGDRVYCSGTYIGQFEAAIRKPQLDLAQRFDGELKTDGFFARMCEELINSSPLEPYFAGVAELQTHAQTICEFGGLLIPGLLQAEGYARALYRAVQPFRSEEEIKVLVRARIERAHIFTRQKPPELWAILDESVLCRPVGSKAIMAEQLTHIAELAKKHKVLVQVVPYSSGTHALLEGNMMLMTFSDAPPVAYAEAPYTGQLLDDPALVERCQRAYDLVRAAALPPEASLALIRSVAEEYGNEA